MKRTYGYVGLAVLTVAMLALGVLALRTRPVSVVEPGVSAAVQSSVAAAKAEQMQPSPVAVFIGDSYSAGAGATSTDKRWTTLVSKRLGWKQINLAKGGTGYLVTAGLAGCGVEFCPNYSGMIQDAVAANPEFVVVAGGRNDLSTTMPAADAISTFFTDLRSALPDARILVISPVWDDDPAPAGLAAIAADVRASAATVSAAYLDIGEPLNGQPQMISGDGLHPNDAGHAALAAAVVAALPDTVTKSSAAPTAQP